MSKKGGFLTPKAIGNRIKAKGLQKLRWYCEMCQKQCRDENGFKCHQTSEGHLRQMRIFAENPAAVVERYSKEFEELFLDTLSRHHNTKRTHANLVYKEYIGDKHHVHMNSTKWSTLTEFVLYLGKLGKVVADETEKGWFISWIDRDPAVLARQAAADAKRKTDMDDETRRQREVARRVAAANEGGASAPASEHEGGGELVRKAGETVSLSLGGGGGGGGVTAEPKAKKPKVSGFAFAAASSSSSSSSSFSAAARAPPSTGRAPSAMESLMLQAEEKRKAEAARAAEAASRAAAKAAATPAHPISGSGGLKSARKDYWLAPGLVVKVMNKKVGDGLYYKSKGVIVEVKERYVGLVRLLAHPGGDSAGSKKKKPPKLQLDQDDLETVIPKAGGRVRVLNGLGRGCEGELLGLDTDKFCASVRLNSGPGGSADPEVVGRVLDKVEYEDLCKVSDEA